jgi:hypothetical protein
LQPGNFPAYVAPDLGTARQARAWHISRGERKSLVDARAALAVALGLSCCLPASADPPGNTAPSASSASPASPDPEARSVAELRNTVVNLLEALVQRGIITREQAQAMIRDAQTKAEAQVAAKEAEQKAQAEAEKGAVRVPYVPEIVKDEISKQVVAELSPTVTQQVEHDINTNNSLRAALPDWVQRMTWTGDVRTRAEWDLFPAGNATNTYLDYNQINSKGGIDKAGPLALLNTTEDRSRLRLRLRYGFDTLLGSGWSAGMRLATGSGEIFPTTNQTLGTSGSKYQIAVDQGYIRWAGVSSGGGQNFTATAGRFANPWLSTDLVWYNDLTFEGLMSNYRANLSADNAHRHDVFVTLGAFPLQPYPVFDPNPYGKDKWLFGGQLGLDLHTEGESRFRLGAAYYDYVHTVGQKNPLNSTQFNWTAPAFFQKGNTVFDISNNPSDPTVNLFALAAAYRIVDVTGIADLRVLSHYWLSITAQAVRNVGYNTDEVSARTGVYVAPRTSGYRADVAFGSAAQASGSWRGAFGYRYLQRDAVMDAFNDEDFHLGGTDTKGYTITFDYWFNPRVWLRARYYSANEIDGPPLGIDVAQLDVNAQF